MFADEVMSFTREESLGTFCSTWEISDWSTLDSQVSGPVFRTNDHEWSVLLYPGGNNEKDFVSIYLESVDCKNGSKDICAQAILCFVDPTDPTRFISQETRHRYNSQEKDYGFSQYASIGSLLGEEGVEPLIKDDSLVIVTIVRLINDPTGVLWHKFINYNSKEMTGHVGLYNQGATCYMNSLFQSLFFTNIYRKSVYQIPTENDAPESSLVYALQRLFYNLQFSDCAVSTTELTKSFGWNSIDSFMQHDVQEFNRLLQDKIEKKMKGTPAEDSIKNIFVGKMKSYIKCINVEYESARSEDYYDIQLNVKGCKNLEESFRDYISVETLEGDNKYMAEGHGLQDAKKGVIFESFPPVLHLQLKRFEYDMMKDSMVKINDRHEFPTAIDLEPYLSESADKSESHKYNLHGVLVHTGDLTGGHYFAFVRPEERDEWFKFDDDRVTPATLNQVLEDNFGGEDYTSPMRTRSENRFTNAYMLVYIRESQTERVLEQVTEEDIPSHLVQRIKQEKLVIEEFHKIKAQQHLYIRAYVTTERSFLMNNGAGFLQFHENNPTDPPIVSIEQVLKTQKLGEYLKSYAERHNVPLNLLRAWNLANRRHGDVRLDIPFTEEHLDLSLEEIRCQFGGVPFLRIYMEYANLLSGSALFHQPGTNIALIFVKLFDPVAQTLSGIGKLHISKDVLVADAVDSFKAMAHFDEDTEIDLYEELGQGQMNILDKTKTFGELLIDDGDIICFQQHVDEIPVTDQQLISEYFYTTVPEYIEFLYNRICVVFARSNDGGNPEIPYECQLELRRDMPYDEVVRRLGRHVGCDPKNILLRLPDYYGIPNRPIKPTDTMTLLDILLQSPKSKTLGRRHEDNNGFLLSKVYFQVLSMDLSVYQSKKLVKFNIVYPSLQENSRYMEFCVPKTSTIKDVAHNIFPKSVVRIYEIAKDKFVREFRPEETVGVCIDDEAELCAEVISYEMKKKEETEGNFKLPVFHYEREITQTHSIPFNFLIIKDEEFHETRKRLQERAGITDEEWEKVKVEIVSKFRKITIKEDNFKLSEHEFKPEDELALNYADPLGRYRALDRGLFFKE